MKSIVYLYSEFEEIKRKLCTKSCWIYVIKEMYLKLFSN